MSGKARLLFQVKPEERKEIVRLHAFSCLSGKALAEKRGIGISTLAYIVQNKERKLYNWIRQVFFDDEMCIGANWASNTRKKYPGSLDLKAVYEEYLLKGNNHLMKLKKQLSKAEFEKSDERKETEACIKIIEQELKDLS